MNILQHYIFIEIQVNFSFLWLPYRLLASCGITEGESCRYTNWLNCDSIEFDRYKYKYKYKYKYNQKQEPIDSTV